VVLKGQLDGTDMDLTPSIWNTPPETLLLSEGEVHLWRLNLNLQNDLLLNLERTLSEDEIQRADRFHFRHDRNRFIASHGWLREILGRYLHVEPEQLRFCYNSYGKPRLDGISGKHLLCFNLSHSHAIGLLALCLDRNIGVDIEHVRPGLDAMQIAQRFFSTYEVTTLLALTDHLKKEAFFNCWTRKEAYIKAHGEGLSIPLDQFSVTLLPGETALLLHTLPDPEEASRWSLFHIDPKPGYVAALAVEGKVSRLQYLQEPPTD
jgi:4'-phosphopantetheinyl transferase